MYRPQWLQWQLQCQAEGISFCGPIPVLAPSRRGRGTPPPTLPCTPGVNFTNQIAQRTKAQA